MVRMIEHRSGNTRSETFPGAACYATLSRAMFYRAVMQGVLQPSKATPLQTLGVLTPLPSFIIWSLPDEKPS